MPLPLGAWAVFARCMEADRRQALVREFMSPDPLQVHASDTIGRARDLAAMVGAHGLPVVEDDAVVGILTTTDLADNWPDDRPVRSVMSRVPHRVAGDATAAEAARLMLERRIHHLIVDEPDGSIGILSSFDLLRAIAFERPEH